MDDGPGLPRESDPAASVRGDAPGKRAIQGIALRNRASANPWPWTLARPPPASSSQPRLEGLPLPEASRPSRERPVHTLRTSHIGRRKRFCARTTKISAPAARHPPPGARRHHLPGALGPPPTPPFGGLPPCGGGPPGEAHRGRGGGRHLDPSTVMVPRPKASPDSPTIPRCPQSPHATVTRIPLLGPPDRRAQVGNLGEEGLTLSRS